MRLWSLHPQYLDRQGLLAVWREGLLAKKVLSGKTRGYKNHPQLTRFRQTGVPLAYINWFLTEIYNEATQRGYHFEARKLAPLKKKLKNIKVSRGQLTYEFRHLLNKLRERDYARYQIIKSEASVKPNRLFQVTAGGVADWEKIKD
ncbi:MAG: pyrimidine dimer DNA glycosylase/endonuclease V [Patescibacteria group bacterium]